MIISQDHLTRIRAVPLYDYYDEEVSTVSPDEFEKRMKKIITEEKCLTMRQKDPKHLNAEKADLIIARELGYRKKRQK